MNTSQSSIWRPTLQATTAASAVAVAQEIAARLQSREQVDAAFAATVQQTAFPEFAYWQPYGIAQGYAGLAVMCSYLDACFPYGKWDVVGHHYLTCAAGGAEEQPYLSMGLFGGLSGLAFAAWLLSRGGTRYRKLL